MDRGQRLVIRGLVLVDRSLGLVVRGLVLVNRGLELVVRGLRLANRGQGRVARGNIVVLASLSWFRSAAKPLLGGLGLALETC